MKKRIDMPSGEALRALYPAQDEGYMRAVRKTLADLHEEREVQPVMKRKISLAVALAAVLTAALACSAVAAGMGVFGKIGGLWAPWGGDAYMNALEEKSVAVGQTQVVPADGAWREIRLTLAQSYYDGESLYIAYEGTGFEDVTDTAWRPTDEQLAKMMLDPDFDGAVMPYETADDGENARDALVQRMLATAAREGSAGAAVYEAYVGDGVTLSGTDAYLELTASEDVYEADGAYFGMREFQRPLLDAARGLDTLALDAKVYRAVTYRYFDGEHWYVARDRQENIATFTVQKNTEETARVTAAERTFEAYKVEAQVVVSELKIEATLAVTNFAGIDVMPDEPRPGELCDYRVYVNGERAHMISGEFGSLAKGRIEIKYEFALPEETLETILFVPQYAGEDGEWIGREEEALTIEFGE